MKKSLKKLISLIIITGIVWTHSMPYCYADENSPTTINVDSDDDTTYTLTSDGENGYDTNTNSDVNTNTSSNTTRQYSQDERNALNTQQNVRNSLEDIYRCIKQTTQYTSGKNFGEGHGNKVVNFSYTQVPKYDIAAMLNAVNQYKISLNANNTWVNRTSDPSTTLANHDGGNEYNTMSVSDRNEIKTAIVLKERGDNDTSKEHLDENISNTLISRGNSINNNDVKINMGTSQTPVSLTWNNPNNNRNRYNNHQHPKYPRQDLYNGIPSFTIPTTNYFDRFKPWVNQAEDEEWPSIVNTDNQIIYKTDVNQYTSAVLNDNIYIGLITEYRVESATKNYVTNINYTSDQRRWTIYLNGEKVSEPVITDNPRHELDFTSVYQQYGAGDYYVEAEQLATFTRSTYASYDICEYLFDMSTGMILWFNENLVTGGGGRGVLLCTEDVNEPEWVATGDTFTITVNNLGNIETTDTINRVD